MIPKIIHYCWFGPKPFSRTVRKCMATWHKYLSDYEFFLWNEETCATFAVAHNLPNPMEHPFVMGAYAAKKYAFVADYVRFWALYHCGGVYLDTDMYVVRSFDDLLENDLFVGWETPQQEYINVALLGVSKHNDCVKNILELYDTLIFDIEQLNKLIVPRLVSPIIYAYPTTQIYSYDYFYAFPWGERNKVNPERFITDNTYALHLWEISWEPWYKRLIRQIVIDIKKILHS